MYSSFSCVLLFIELPIPISAHDIVSLVIDKTIDGFVPIFSQMAAQTITSIDQVS